VRPCSPARECSPLLDLVAAASRTVAAFNTEQIVTLQSGNAIRDTLPILSESVSGISMSLDAEFGGGSPNPTEPAAERRSVPRYTIIANVEIFDPIERTRLAASVSEIGANGCYTRVPNPMKQHTVVQLLIQRLEESFKSWGMVVHAQEGRGMGINFFRPEPSQVQILLSWIRDLHVQRKAR
jgi:hypothetical protein